MGFEIKVEEPCASGYEVLVISISGTCAAAIRHVQEQSLGTHQLTDAMAILDIRARATKDCRLRGRPRREASQNCSPK